MHRLMERQITPVHSDSTGFRPENNAADLNEAQEMTGSSGDTSRRRERSPTSATGRPNAVGACSECRRVKMRCIRASENSTLPCNRCLKIKKECVTLLHKPAGRKKAKLGSGVEKVKTGQTVSAVKRSERTDSSPLNDSSIASTAHTILPSPYGASENPPYMSHPVAPDYQQELDIRNLLPALRNGEQTVLASPDDQSAFLSSMQYDPGRSGSFAASTSLDPSGGLPWQAPVATSLSPQAIRATSLPCATQQAEQRGNISNPIGLLADVSSSIHRPSTGATSPLQEAQTPSVSVDLTASKIFHLTGEPPLGFNLSTPAPVLLDGLDFLLGGASQRSDTPPYFTEPRSKTIPDIGPELDPIDLGLVTLQEAQELFPVYFTELNDISGILDPIIHTPTYCRSRSSLLFTWILSLAAQTRHEHATLAHRLRLHGQKLAQGVLRHGYKSVEVVQGLYLSLVFEAPAASLQQEKTWLYTSTAVAIAVELGLNQKSQTSNRRSGHGSRFPSPHSSDEEGLTTGSATAAQRRSEDVYGDKSRRLDLENERVARNGERTWLRIMLWDRAHAAAAGRVLAFPESDLTLTVDSWWTHPLALDCDRQTCAFVTLRRLLATLNTQIRTQLCHEGVSRKTDWVRYWIDSVLDPWVTTWLGFSTPASPKTPSDVANMQLYYVYRHGRLWTMSLALHGSLTPENCNAGMGRECYEAAAQCCEYAIGLMDSDQSSKLHIVLFAMVAYSAVFLLKLLPFVFGPTNLSAQARTLGLLAQIGRGLVKIGSNRNFNGKAVKYGDQLLFVLREKAQRLAKRLEAANMQSYANAAAANGVEGERQATHEWHNNVVAFDMSAQNGAHDFANFDFAFDFTDPGCFESILAEV